MGAVHLSKWNDPQHWKALLDGSGCPICTRGLPLHVIAELECSWLTMPEEAPMPGYVCLVSRVHAVELHELDVATAEAFMRDLRRVSKAVHGATGAVKLNYEIHGNTLPHLHMHFFPRYAGDPFEGRAIEPRKVVQPVYAPGQFSEVKGRILVALD
jgi:diadenosine tetraphosphate (Ap4A) HIT family hydrolase